MDPKWEAQVTFCWLKGTKDTLKNLSSLPFSHMPHTSPPPERAHHCTVKPCAFFPWTLPKVSLSPASQELGTSLGDFLSVLNGTRWSHICSSSIFITADVDLHSSVQGFSHVCQFPPPIEACPLFAEWWEWGEGAWGSYEVPNVHLWESAWICPLRPLLLDAASLTLSPELSKVGRVKKQCSLHSPITTESATLGFGFVQVACVCDLFPVWNTHGGGQTAHTRC